VDPDLGGAVAALSWFNPVAPAAPASENCSSGSEASPHHGSLPPLDQIAVELHDMPVEVWKYGTRDKRQPNAAGLTAILQRYVDAVKEGSALWHNLGGSSGARTLEPIPRAGKVRRRTGSGNRSADTSGAVGQPTDEPLAGASGAAAAGASHIGMCTSDVIAAITASDVGGEPAPVLRAVMEYSMPPHASGKFAWFGIGFASGLLNGLLAAQGIPYHRVAGEVHQFW
jgi:hypothetical protein